MGGWKCEMGFFWFDTCLFVIVFSKLPSLVLKEKADSSKAGLLLWTYQSPHEAYLEVLLIDQVQS